MIQSERIDLIQKDIHEIKSLLQDQRKESFLNEWLSKTEARKKLHVCLKTLNNYLSKGILPYSRFAGKIYIKAADIQLHLEKHYIKA